MAVVAPTSAVGAAVLPVLAGLAGGDRPVALVWIGLVLVLPGIWLVSRQVEDGTKSSSSGRGAFVDGLLGSWPAPCSASGSPPGNASDWCSAPPPWA